jgi:antitoxin component YwqK of YwqJK toxin-antitoxin module
MSLLKGQKKWNFNSIFARWKSIRLRKLQKWQVYGYVRFYYSNGQINNESYYDENGLQQGAFKLWYKSGKVRQSGYMKNGRIIGNTFLYYENGAIEHVSHYDLIGNKDSTWTYYSPTGSIAKREKYKADSLVLTFK